MKCEHARYIEIVNSLGSFKLVFFVESIFNLNYSVL